MRTGEHGREDASVLEPEQDGALRTSGIHHGPDVVDPILEREGLLPGWPVRHPGAAAVEGDQPRHRREPTQERPVVREVPPDVHVRDPSGHVDEVERTVTDHLVGDVDAVGGPHVAGLGSRHQRIVAGKNEVGKPSPSKEDKVGANSDRG